MSPFRAPDPPGCCRLMFSTPAAVRCTLKSRSFDSKYSMLRRPSLICPSRRESTAGLLVDWRMALAALIRALSLSILRCTLATVSSTLDMAAGVCQIRRGGRWCVSPPTGAARWWCLAMMAGVSLSARSPNRHRSCSVTLCTEGAASWSAEQRIWAVLLGAAGSNDGSGRRQRDVVKT